MSSIIEVENLSFSYTPERTILKDLGFEVTPGTFLAIAGPNGAGKSTLLNLLCRLLKSKSGIIRIDGAAIDSYNTEELAKKVSVVRQEFVPAFDFSVLQTVMMARTPYYTQIGFETKTDTEIVNEAMEATDTAHFASRALRSLSSGERQRVFIARALAQNTPVVLLDEPTSFLDLKHQVRIYDLLKTAQLEKGKTIVAVTHDINLAAQYADVALMLDGNCGYHTGKLEDVFSLAQIEKVFGVKTFAAKVGEGKFFLPLGEFAKDRGIINTSNNTNKRK
jgi:iron complex transport system ATP-binding protein